MTSFTIDRHSGATTLTDLRAVRTATEILLGAITAAGPDDTRWVAAGPLVSRAAVRLRETLGVPVRGECRGAAPVVRERDFADAARWLLQDGASIREERTARDYVRIALESAVAFS